MIPAALVASLLVRPLGRTSKKLIEARIDDRTKDRKVRPLLFLALAHIPGTDVRDKLLRHATRTDERDDVRVAALIGLSYRWNVSENYRTLHRALPQGRNDPVAAAMLFALVCLVSWGLFQLLSARAAYLHTGAMMGSIMAANVFFHIINKQTFSGN